MSLHDALREELGRRAKRFVELTDRLADPGVAEKRSFSALLRERGLLERCHRLEQELTSLEHARQQARELLEERGLEAGLHELARLELEELGARERALEEAIKSELVRDEDLLRATRNAACISAVCRATSTARPRSRQVRVATTAPSTVPTTAQTTRP